LVFVTGPPGIGKTALARSLGRDCVMAADFLTRPPDVNALVIDAADRLLREVVAAATAWCDERPGRSVVVTSRAIPPGLPKVTLTGLASEEAVALFLETGGAHSDWSEEDAADLAQLVDGNPLAIRHAACMSSVLSASQWTQRFDEGRTSTWAAAPEGRHRTLDGAVQWAWQTLSPELQRFLQLWAWWRGPMTLAQVETLADSIGVDGVAVLGQAHRASVVRRVGDRYELDALARHHARSVQHHSDGAERRQAEGVLVEWAEQLAVDLRSYAGRVGLESLLSARGALMEVGGSPALRARALLASRPAWEEQSQDLAWQRVAIQMVREGAIPAALEARLWVAIAETSKPSVPTDLDQIRAGLDRTHATSGQRLAVEAICALHDVAHGRWDSARQVLSRVFADPEVLPAVEAMAWLAEFHLRSGNAHDNPVECYERAAEAFGRAGLDRSQAETWLRGAWHAATHGDAPRASAMLNAAETSLRDDDPSPLLALLRGVSLLELGHLDAAQSSLERCVALAERAVGSPKAQIGATRALAMIAVERGELDVARDMLTGTTPTWNPSGRATGLAVVDLMSGDAESAEKHLLDALSAVPRLAQSPEGYPLYSALLATCRSLRGELDSAHELLDACGEAPPPFVHVLRALVDGTPEPEYHGRRPGLRERLSLRIFERYSTGAAEPKWSVGHDGTWFDVGQGKVDLSRRGAMKRVLAALVANQGTPVDVYALFEAGWPGESLLPDRAAHRVHVTVSELRKKGLRDFLVRQSEGYLLAGMQVRPS